jgi:hypothetical protein
MAVIIQSSYFRAVTPCGLVSVYGHFREISCLWKLLSTCLLTTCPYSEQQILTEFSVNVHSKEPCFKEPRLSTRTLYTLGHIYVPESPAQIKFCPRRSWVWKLSSLHIWVLKVSPVEVETPAQWNMIASRNTTSASELSPSSILPSSSSHFALIPAKEKFGAHFRIFSTFLTFSIV